MRVLARVAASHLRVGTFQYFAARGDVEGLRRLLDYTLTRHDPALRDAPERAPALLRAVAPAPGAADCAVDERRASSTV